MARQMGEWIAIEHWERCRELERPGIVFEIRNAEGLSLFTPCTATVPTVSFDWRLPPFEFRPIEEAAPEHSAPLPPPKG